LGRASFEIIPLRELVRWRLTVTYLTAGRQLFFSPSLDVLPFLKPHMRLWRANNTPRGKFTANYFSRGRTRARASERAWLRYKTDGKIRNYPFTDISKSISFALTK